jgi:hypothetical protein
MKYHWMTCPKCDGELAINYTESPSGTAGSVRRWSRDRHTNDGRKFQIVDRQPDTPFQAECPCGAILDIPARADATRAEREEDMRVKI